MITTFSGIRFGILGLGRSGIGAAGLIKRLGGTALISDKKDAAHFTELFPKLAAQGIDVETGGHDRLFSEFFDFLIVSPGAVLNDDRIKLLRANGTRIWSELELASRCFDGKWIAVTGSNGKTTTVTLIDSILREAGLKSEAVGNIGTAWSERLPSSDTDVFVVEVSSFQMEHTFTAKPTVCVLLNVLENHLDRHGDIETYGALKLKLAAKQSSEEFLVLNRDDRFLMSHGSEIAATKKYFGRQPAEWNVKGDSLFLRNSESEELVLSTSEWPLVGRHNLLNAGAAGAAAHCLSVSVATIRAGLRKAKAVEHRIEVVATINGIRYVNDSKSTNLTATLTALDAIDGSVVLLFGGRPKRESFSPLAAQLGTKIRRLIVFGEAREKIKSDLGSSKNIEYCDDMTSALEAANRVANYEDTVLLSPGCASFDQFENFEERGKQFKKLVIER